MKRFLGYTLFITVLSCSNTSNLVTFLPNSKIIKPLTTKGHVVSYSKTYPTDLVMMMGGRVTVKEKGSDGKISMQKLLVSTLYAGRNEETNAQYRTYLSDLKKTDAIKYSDALPDTTIYDGVQIPKNYFSCPKFEAFPVIGVTYDQAVAYCKWKTSYVKKMMAKELGIEESEITFRGEYRLPTKKEWIYAAAAMYKFRKPKKPHGYKYNWNTPDGFHFFPTRNEARDKWLDPIHPAEHKKSNDFGCYNFYETVAEWTSSSTTESSSSSTGFSWDNQKKEESSKKIILGGSWKHPQESCEIGHVDIKNTDNPPKIPTIEIKEVDKNKAYDYVGFRCFMNYGATVLK